MYKLIVSDLDETLLPADRKVSKGNREAIQYLKEKGIKFVPSSGRGYTTIDGTLRELGLFEQRDEYVISFNGGVITENHQHRVLYQKGLPFKLAEKIYQRGFRHQVGIQVYTLDTVYVAGSSQKEIAELSKWMNVVETKEKDLGFLRGQEIMKCIYMNDDLDYLTSVEQDLTDIAADLDISYSSNRFMEINTRGVNKGNGLKALAEYLGITLKETIAVGDNWNDISMIREAGLGIAVQNAADDVKNAADVTIQSTCDDEVLAELVERFIK